VISPQFGHGNFVASVPGDIIRWHDVHVGTAIVVAVFSLIALFALLIGFCLVGFVLLIYAVLLCVCARACERLST